MAKPDEASIRESTKVERRDDKFSKRASTKIWSEVPSADNPYLPDTCRCHGYDLLELVEKRSFADMFFLLFQGELPPPSHAELLEHLLTAFINPGPRHPATRAAMNAGIGKTDPSHILPISLSVLGGSHLGAAEVESAIRWLRRNSGRKIDPLVKELIEQLGQGEGDVHIAPGFGSRFGDVEILPQKIMTQFLALDGAGEVMRWADEFAKALTPHHFGWLSTGLVAAVLCDLGFQPRVGPGIYQLLSAPGLFAHGIEQASKPLSAMPFPDDENYIIET